jgi:hypothetical protein
MYGYHVVCDHYNALSSFIISFIQSLLSIYDFDRPMPYSDIIGNGHLACLVRRLHQLACSIFYLSALLVANLTLALSGSKPNTSPIRV